MTPIDETFSRTLDTLPVDATTVWLFESAPARHAAERRARDEGRDLRVRSAYRTLLQDVIEDGLLDGADRATIHYPVVEGCPADRFRLECYPLHALFDRCEIDFQPAPHEGEGLPAYRIEAGGRSTPVRVPVRWSADEEGHKVLAASGWSESAGGESGPLRTEYEAIFARACEVMRSLPLDPLNSDEQDGPYFARLILDVTIPAEDVPLPVGHECISLAEALHEDIYFASLETFRHRLGLGPEERSVSCGQAVPRIATGSIPRLSMRLESGAAIPEAQLVIRPALDSATQWLPPAAIEAHLAALGGTRYKTTSRQGRAVHGTFVKGTGPAGLAISAGQHANESSPIVGALRAAHALATDGVVRFTLNPLENPDGYAVFRDLCLLQPRHMHHAPATLPAAPT